MLRERKKTRTAAALPPLHRGAAAGSSPLADADGVTSALVLVAAVVHSSAPDPDPATMENTNTSTRAMPAATRQASLTTATAAAPSLLTTYGLTTTASTAGPEKTSGPRTARLVASFHTRTVSIAVVVPAVLGGRSEKV